MTKNEPLDKLLAVIFILSMISTFVFVWAVEQGFETEAEEIVLLTSDSSMDFPVLILDETPANYEAFVNGYYLNLAPNYYNFTKAPVYIGNNTHAMSINGSTHTAAQFAQYIFVVPNIKNWIITELTINQTKNLDTDLTYNVEMYFMDSLTTLEVGTPNNFIGEQIYTDDGFGAIVGSYGNHTVDISLQEALDIQSKATNSKQTVIILQVIDKNSDGLGSWAWTLEVEIKGKLISAYDVNSYILASVVAGDIIMTVVFIYSADGWDVGKVTNDIPDSRVKSKPRKKGGKK